MKLFDALRLLGFSEYEAKAFISLLKGEMSAKEIAEISGIPRTSVYDVMRSLEAKGFVQKFGRPAKFKIVDPEEVIATISKKTDESIKVLKEELSKLRREEIDVIRIIRGDSVVERLEEFVSSAKKEVLVFLSFLADEVKKILLKAKCKLVVISSNVKGAKGEVYELKSELKAETCHGFLVADGRKIFIIFLNDEKIGILAENESVANFLNAIATHVMRSLKY